MKSNSPNILVCGCIYGAGNIGDEAILHGLIRLLPTESKVAVCVAGHTEAYRAIGLDVFGISQSDIFEAVQWADHVVLGGASLLTDPMGPGYPIGNCAFILQVAQAYGRPCTFVGIGAARLNGADALALAQKWYPYASQFFVRNEDSKAAIVTQLKVDPARIIPICDPAFLLTDYVDAATGAALLARHGIQIAADSPLVAVSVVNEGFEIGRNYHREIAQACEELYRTKNARIVFIYSEIRPGEKFDIAAADKVKQHLKVPYLDLPPEFFSPREFISMLSCFDEVVAMRMHVLIMTALSGVGCAMVVREDKVKQILKDLDFESSGDINDVTAHSVVAKVNEILESRSALKSHLQMRVERLQTMAFTNFKQHIQLPGRGPGDTLAWLRLRADLLKKRVRQYFHR